MRWLVGCLGVIFVLFGGCVLFSGLMAISSGPYDPDSGIIAAAGVVGGIILFFGLWVLYRAVIMRRAHPCGDQG
jgi:hypothetical protein